MSTSDDLAAKQIIGAQVVTGTLNELNARQRGKKVSNPFQPEGDSLGGDIISGTLNSVNAMKAGTPNLSSSGNILNNKT